VYAPLPSALQLPLGVSHYLFMVPIDSYTKEVLFTTDVSWRACAFLWCGSVELAGDREVWGGPKHWQIAYKEGYLNG